MDIKIEYVDIDSIQPYEGNAKIHTDAQIDRIAQSIQEFGFNDPIGVWRGEIEEGHGRWLAAKKLGLQQVPVIRLDHMTDAQRRAYVHIHNQLTLESGFDVDMLAEEIGKIEGVDMESYGFDVNIDVPEVDDPIDYRHPSFQHNVFENQERQQFPTDSYYGMPYIEPTQTVGDKFLRFMDWQEVDDLSEYICHFYYDDYKFQAAWTNPDKYIDRLYQFKAVVSPDFSVYTDFPRALQILACYRRQWCGAYWQQLGIDVIPDVVWGDAQSYDYCFDGLPKGGTVAVSSVGVARDADWNGESGVLFKAGYDEMLKRLEPTTILFYGDVIDGLEGNIIHIPSYYDEKREALNAREKREDGETRGNKTNKRG